MLRNLKHGKELLLDLESELPSKANFLLYSKRVLSRSGTFVGRAELSRSVCRLFELSE